MTYNLHLTPYAFSPLLLLRPEVEHPGLFRDWAKLIGDCPMCRCRCVSFQPLFILEREHEAMRESFIMFLGAVILPPLKSFDRLALGREFRERILESFHLF